MDGLMLAVAATLLSPVGSGESLPDPLSPATAGGLQCYSPDIARKICQSLAAYARSSDGEIVNTAVVLISTSPPITMTTTTPVVVRDGVVCGAIRAMDIGAATFTLSGRPLDDAQTSSLRQQMSANMSAMFDREICTAYKSDGTAEATLGGALQPVMKVIWVAPDQGYAVGP